MPKTKKEKPFHYGINVPLNREKPFHCKAIYGIVYDKAYYILCVDIGMITAYYYNGKKLKSFGIYTDKVCK